MVGVRGRIKTGIYPIYFKEEQMKPNKTKEYLAILNAYATHWNMLDAYLESVLQTDDTCLSEMFMDMHLSAKQNVILAIHNVQDHVPTYWHDSFEDICEHFNIRDVRGADNV
jgi:hypothetical protein